MDFIIIGAGGLGRELESWTASTPSFASRYKLLGYLDDNLAALDNTPNDFQVLEVISDASLKRYEHILIGIANPSIKKSLFLRIKNNPSTSLLEFQHESATVGKNNSIDEGLVLCPNIVITCNVTIGKCVFVNAGSQIGHDVTIGAFTSIMANVDLGGGAVIGDEVLIGSNAVILPGVNIPNNTVIGAGSVVVKSLKQSGTYFGNPAKRIF